MKKITLFLFAAMFFVGCGKHRDGTSVWADGLFILPVLTFSAFIFFAIRAWRTYKSGSNLVVGGKITDKEGGNMPLTQIGWFWFAVMLFLATAGIILWVNLEK